MIQITDMNRGYSSAEERKADVQKMYESGEYNRFIFYRDTAAEFAVQYLRNPKVGPLRYSKVPNITY